MMADEPEDLPEEVDTPDIVDEQADDGAPDAAGEDQPDGDEEAAKDDEEPSYEIEVEGVVADPEETPTIKKMRLQLREQARTIAELTKTAPQTIEVGEKPTLESCEWDEVRFETELDAYKDRKAKAEQLAADAQKQAELGQQRFNQAFTTYRAKAAELGVPDYEAVEQRVASALPLTVQNGLLLYLKDKAPSVVLALDKHPQLLEEVSQIAANDPLEAIIRLNDISKGIKVVQRRKGLEPDKPLRGSASVANVGADKKLAEMEREAERTGDRSKLIAYRRTLKTKG